ncbi:MAG TPA: GNAT family N-acetyltransferase [Polyangiaceae bacterium LLY-WYZ-15_(1-7)]|nr:hypothetical protein [Sandaracinus sp.]HJL03169.1 GNAT family N-acetyltransferase [Polyangiaceae bacterium LLY-WYZ-15_(1-7)]HJL10297.1 GNAT family N-acetyltransferase [Polyangiaceae bacterium LLY-WYZ-15_(1-7)]HJL26446.1 GNAT family N-acetyltransferase [Polyangiaceae bacterium LLY-WYZ-15_(1-7)]HJL32957.1 GNAT family N-acetyltransferase [Polyangiaceae bacterium LLY-WYZ-15_(1-7)]
MSASRQAPPVRRAGPDDAEAVLAILDEGFAADPFVRWVVERPGRSAERTAAARRRYLRLVLERLVLPHGEVWMDEGARAAALWVAPGGWDLPLGEQLRLLPTVARVVGWRRLPRMAYASAAIEEGRPPAFWYLALVATREAARGQGLGRAVLAPVLERCDVEGELALLETSKRKNLGWYRRLGFEERRHVDLGEGAPPVWSLVREPAER